MSSELVEIDTSETTELQRAFAVHYVANGGDAKKAAQSAGYSPTSAKEIGHRLARLPTVKALIRLEAETRIINQGAAVAIHTLIAIMGNEEMSGAVRVEASKTMLDRAGHISKAQVKPERDGPKALNDMTIDELDLFIKQGAAAVDKARDASAIQGECAQVDAQDDATVVIEQGTKQPE
jgi:hypothetical protein